jgi:ribosome-associated heat shock protein Hsp15
VSVRLDKWLQVARVFKTRTQATRACNLGRVRVNGQTVKPHRNLALDDHVEIEIGDWMRHLVVKELRDRPLPKAEASRVFEDLSPPRPRLASQGHHRLATRVSPAVAWAFTGTPLLRRRSRISTGASSHTLPLPPVLP